MIGPPLQGGPGAGCVAHVRQCLGFGRLDTIAVDIVTHIVGLNTETEQPGHQGIVVAIDKRVGHSVESVHVLVCIHLGVSSLRTA